MMQNKQHTKSRFLLVGDLQVYTMPFASLYVNEATKSLYVFIRIAEGNDAVKGIITPVAANTVKAYLNKETDLRHILQANKSRLCDIQNHTGHILWSVPYKNSYKQVQNNDNFFDDDFCYEHYELSYFLNQYQ